MFQRFLVVTVRLCLIISTISWTLYQTYSDSDTKKSTQILMPLRTYKRFLSKIGCSVELFFTVGTIYYLSVNYVVGQKQEGASSYLLAVFRVKVRKINY